MKKSAENARLSYEKHPDPEQDDYCPGFQVLDYEVGGIGYSTLVRCQKLHPHRKEIEEPSGREVPAYGFINRLPTREWVLQSVARRQRRAMTELERRRENARKMRQSIGDDHA